MSFLKKNRMRSRLALSPRHTKFGKRMTSYRLINLVNCSRLKIITGLKTLNSKLPCEPAKPMVTSLPNTCVQTIVIASHCVGFILPGMIDEPGSFSGNSNSKRPQRGPEPTSECHWQFSLMKWLMFLKHHLLLR